MIEIKASELVPGKRYYIERILPYPNQCNKFRARHIGNNTEYSIITSNFNEVLSVTSYLAHTHTWPTLMIPHSEYRYYQYSQDKADEDKENRKKRKNEALTKYYLQELHKITGDCWFNHGVNFW